MCQSVWFALEEVCRVYLKSYELPEFEKYGRLVMSVILARARAHTHTHTHSKRTACIYRAMCDLHSRNMVAHSACLRGNGVTLWGEWRGKSQYAHPSQVTNRGTH